MGGGRHVDEIAIVEAMYELSSSPEEWLLSVSRAVAANLGADMGTLPVHFSPRDDGGVEAHPVFVDTPPEMASGFADAIAPFLSQDPAMLSLMMRTPLSGFLETFPADHPYRRACAEHLHRAGIRDTVGFIAFDTPSHAVSIAPAFSREATPTVAAKGRYHRLAAHMSAASRLRRRLGARPGPGPDAVALADAVFDPEGRRLHASEAAHDDDALDALRSAIRAREKARGRLRRRDPDEALSMWTALVSGRWSLVDRIEMDGRRFVLAIANGRDRRDSRALTPRERQVAELAAMGAANGEIAYTLAISAGCVSTHLHAATRKLKCHSRHDLIRMMRAGNDEFALDVDGGLLRVLAESDPTRPAPGTLTLAEREVLEAIRQGRSNAHIAATRGRSERTVANQVASILRKTGRGSRYELMTDAG
jgi:DNA-binding NarL/FixJ family response regulator